MDCGNSQAAHAHVRACPGNAANGELFSSLASFDQAQNTRRKAAIQQAALKIRLNKHLEDIGLQL